MTVFQIVFLVKGGHVHCQLFAGKPGTLASCGSFVLRRGQEFRDMANDFVGLRLEPNRDSREFVDACRE